MAIKNLKGTRRLKIRRRIRKHIFGTAVRPRLSIYKSNTAIYVQLIDDEQAHTLVACSSKSLNIQSGANTEAARQVGEAVAKYALSKGIEDVVFDRSGYIYHGRVRALAEGARAAGLKF
jgi:large subunit ribosomal protein L18